MARLQTRTVRVHGDTITVPLNASVSSIHPLHCDIYFVDMLVLMAQEAGFARDTLIRAIYGNLFNWLLSAINSQAENTPAPYWYECPCGWSITR
jgi:hypothetical protein